MKILSHFLAFLLLTLFCHANPPPLNIEGSTFVAKYNGVDQLYYFYSSIVTYHDDVAKLFPKEEQLAGLVKQANDEALMKTKEHQAAAGEELTAAGMHMLAVGKQAIFSSSLRSNKVDQRPFFYDIIPSSAPIKQQLLECFTDDPHRTRGACGEIVGMQLWHLANPGKQWSNDLGAISIFWSSLQKQTIAPCGKPRKNGCMRFNQQFGLHFPTKYYGPKDVIESNITPMEYDRYESLWCDDYDKHPGSPIGSPDQAQPPEPHSPQIPQQSPPDLRDQVPDFDMGLDDADWEEVMQSLS